MATTTAAATAAAPVEAAAVLPKSKKLLVLSVDVETTGLSTLVDEVTQVAVVMERFTVGADGTVTSTERLPDFVSYACCKREIHPEAVRITGITNSMLKDKPAPAEVYGMLAAHVSKHADEDDVRVLVGHNAVRYDVPLMVSDVIRSFGHDKSVAWWRSLRLSMVADSLCMARLFVDETKLLRNSKGLASYKLGDLHVALCEKAFEGAHDAREDACATLALLAHESLRAPLVAAVCADEAPVLETTGVCNAMQLVTKCADTYTRTRLAKRKNKCMGRSLVPLIEDSAKRAKQNE